MASNADFVASLDQWVAKVSDKADQVVRGVAEQALAKVKEYTPVDTGNLRAAWSIVPGDTELPIIPHDKRSEATQGADTTALAVDLSSIFAGGIIRLVNPTAYARPIEYGYAISLKAGGQRHVEGKFMATRTVAELPEIADRVIRDLSA